MPDAILLILGVPDPDEDQRIRLGRIHGRMDVISNGQTSTPSDKSLMRRAFVYAKQSSKRLVALQVLTSDLFHWGASDVILSGPAKARFMGHIREQVGHKSLKTDQMLQDNARQYNVSLEIKKVETDDPVSEVLEEAKKDYDRIFLAREKKRFFPIFKQTLDQHLRKSISIPIEH